ncbi:MAG: sensor histidine kinase [Vicinamibacteria bacterium]
MPALERLAGAYAEALREYLELGGEAPLYQAYQIGREALASGLGALEVATVHQQALLQDLLRKLAPEQSARTTRRASEFFAEALAPFEANRLGHQESAVLLSELNQDLERRVRAAVDAYQAASVELDEQRRMEALKDEFVSLVSHELRTPLTSIHGALGILGAKFQAQLPDEAARLLEVARRNSERLKRLIDDVLDQQKAEAGGLSFEIRPLEVAPLLQQTIDANQPYAAQLGVKLGLREAPSGLRLLADPDRVAQVLTNLLSNAVKFSSPGDEVLVAAERQGTSVVITVVDRGPGIPAGFRERVFQRFAQADASSTRRRGGTGLGLSISKAIVERMQGRIGFRETPGGGTTFYFELPEEASREERRA